MKKRQATQLMETLYESTYDDAVAYIGGMTGTLEQAENILSAVYFEMFKYFSKCKRYDEADSQNEFLRILKDTIAPHIPDEINELQITAKNRKSIKSVEKLLDFEYDITVTELFESNLNKEIYSSIMEQPLLHRKIFILYFYCGYQLEQISRLLNIKENDISHILYTLLKQTHDSFLKNKILKSEEKE